MHSTIRNITLSLCLFFSVTAGAQEIPALPVDPDMVKGVLPSGVEYYLMKDGSVKGFADIALVQKGRNDAASARSSLTDISGFMSSKGVGYGPGGFLSMVSNSAVYRFDDVPVFDRVTSDSTFVLLTAVMNDYSGPQALMVSGDIDTKKLPEQLYMYSLMVPKVNGSTPENEYVWEDRMEPEIKTLPGYSQDYTTISLEYRSSRPQKELMNTAQPFVSRKFADKAYSVISRRVRDAFYIEQIPVTGMRFEYRDASCTDGDETFTFSLDTRLSELDRAVALIAGTLSALDREGASVEEYRYASDDFVQTKSGVDKMIASYLYGSSIASDSQLREFFERRTLSVEDELNLFNGFLTAMLDPEKNLRITVATPDDKQGDALLRTFRNVWALADSSSCSFRFGDLSLFKPRKEPRRVKKTGALKDPVTGGEIWNFSNGLKVIYKQIPDNGRFEYTLLLCGGVTNIKGADGGEASYAGDVAGLFDIAGLNQFEFNDLLSASDISFKTEISLSDMRITGSAPKERLEDVLNILMSYEGGREFNRDVYEYYRQCELLKSESVDYSVEGLRARMEDMMEAGFPYSGYRAGGALRDDFPSRVDKYISSQFAKSGDGVLILIGDLDPIAVENVLTRRLGAFPANRQYSFRPKLSDVKETAWLTHTDAGHNREEVDLLVSSPLPFSLDDYIAFQLACIVLERHLASSLGDKGMYCEMSSDYRIMPLERADVLMRFNVCDENGIPICTDPVGKGKILPVVRELVFGLAGIEVSGELLEWSKSYLRNRRASHVSTPSGLMRYSVFRNSEGKDLVTGYDEALKKMSAPDVEKVLRSFATGAKVEYVVK